MSHWRAIQAIFLAIVVTACSSTTPTSIQRGLLASAESRAARGDLSGAATEYRNLAESGVVQAQYRLGLAYVEAAGVPYNIDASVQWLSLAANAGDIVSMRTLGEMYADEESEIFDPPVAARWYAAAAEQGDETARFALAELAIESAQSTADQQLAVRSLQEGARNGYVRAQLRLAQLYERGQLVGRDPLEAKRWFAIAANVLNERAQEGDTRAQTDLAKLYLEGKGIERDLNRAIGLLERASDAGRLSATITLAKLYREGAQGLPKNGERAVYWRDQASRRNHASSAYELGKWFMRGDGIGQDPIKAQNYFRHAAQLGEKRAYIYLGEIAGGKFEEMTDYESAADWYGRATEVGDGKAMFKLAELHEREHLANADPIRALALYQASARNGYSRGTSRAERLERQMSDDERSKASELLAQILANET